ncbi:MAG TPA: hypothetical protein ENI23_10620, partial [bacterium]|nr:hypothetical protein [bacterium]
MYITYFVINGGVDNLGDGWKIITNKPITHFNDIKYLLDNGVANKVAPRSMSYWKQMLNFHGGVTVEV